MDHVNYNGQLYHHGVKGMKWGVRRFQTKDGSLTPAGKKRYRTAAQDRADRAADEARRAHRLASKYTSAMDRKAANRQAKADAKAAKIDATKSAVKNYKKKWDEAEKASELEDAKWNEVSERYKALGKNRIQRIMNAGKTNTAEGKAYSKAFDEAERASNLADTKWNEVNEAYRKTGMNHVSRIINNARYG